MEMNDAAANAIMMSESAIATAAADDARPSAVLSRHKYPIFCVYSLLVKNRAFTVL